MYKKISLLLLLFYFCNACAEKDNEYIWKTKEVNVSAYNSVHWQTDNEPSVAAWGDTLLPGMKVIAVSKDLLNLGLDRGTQVKIKGLDGIYVVMDKMNSRWKNKIDVYMGTDVEKARDWGKKKIKIEYRVKREADIKEE
ncbi:3D domain-containing protein [Zobellia amurskyensis]|uniref:3D domain-containing protein n=1 Tax=Zobellia amurskyensis TaxID=248905 RepID=UPI001F1F0A45|nr:3D domain-containing protein [Zobellia amurskyensis]